MNVLGDQSIWRRVEILIAICLWLGQLPFPALTSFLPWNLVASKMVLKLYGLPISGAVRIVAFVLHEKKVPFELVPVDFSKKEHKLPEYLEKQPFGQVPYIVCDVVWLYVMSWLTQLDLYSRMMTVLYSTKAGPSATISPRSILTKEPRYSQLNSKPMRCSTKQHLLKLFILLKTFQKL